MMLGNSRYIKEQSSPGIRETFLHTQRRESLAGEAPTQHIMCRNIFFFYLSDVSTRIFIEVCFVDLESVSIYLRRKDAGGPCFFKGHPESPNASKQINEFDAHLEAFPLSERSLS